MVEFRRKSKVPGSTPGKAALKPQIMKRLFLKLLLDFNGWVMVTAAISFSISLGVNSWLLLTGDITFWSILWTSVSAAFMALTGVIQAKTERFV